MTRSQDPKNIRFSSQQLLVGIIGVILIIVLVIFMQFDGYLVNRIEKDGPWIKEKSVVLTRLANAEEDIEDIELTVNAVKERQHQIERKIDKVDNGVKTNKELLEDIKEKLDD